MRLIAAKIVVLSIVLILVSGFMFCGYSQTNMSNNNRGSIFSTIKKPEINLRSMSLLDPSRFTMRQQYIMDFSSVGGSGSLMGTYINSMEYRFKSPIIMRLKVAYQSQSANMFGNSNAFTGLPNNQNGNLFIPSFDLIYQPSEKMSIGLFFRDYRGTQQNYGYDRFGRYGYSPFMRYWNTCIVWFI